MLWWGMLIVALLLAYFLGGRLQTGHDRYIMLPADHYPSGTIHQMDLVLSKGGGLYVINNKEKFYALIATDPYDNCRIHWNEEKQAFYSPCSDHKYAIDGSWISGSAPGGLDHYPTTLRYGNLYIDTETRLRGTPRPIAADK
jgi:hypothetical protein